MYCKGSRSSLSEFCFVHSFLCCTYLYDVLPRNMPFAKRCGNFAEKESRNPKGDTASKTISLSKKKQIQKVLSEWIKQLGGNSPKHQQPV